MSPLTSILATDRHQPPPKLLPNVLAGLTVGLVSLTYSVSFAALIFTDNLSPGFPQGVGSALITSAIVGAIVALCSSFPFAIAGPDSTATAAIALMTAAITGEIQQSNGGAERLFPTVWMAIALSTCLTGLLFAAVASGVTQIYPQPLVLPAIHQTTAIAELPTTLYCLSKSQLQTMCQEHPQVVTVFEDFIIRFLIERLTYAHTDIEEFVTIDCVTENLRGTIDA